MIKIQKNIYMSVLCLGMLFSVCNTQTAAAASQPESMWKDVNMSIGYDYYTRSGEGKKVSGRIYTAKAQQKISSDRSQYFLLSYVDSNIRNLFVKGEAWSGTVAYGQAWQSGTMPGIVFNLGGYLSHGRNDYGQSFVSDAYFASNSAGVIGGVAKEIPMSARNAATIGSNLILSYQEEWVATATPYAEIKHQATPKLKLYTRVGATASTGEANITGGGFLVSPAVGFSYNMGEFALGAKYAYEDAADHRGSRVGFTLSKSF